jgi:HlyD family secretion protein
MDIPRGKEVIRRRSIRRAIYIALGAIIIGGGAYAVTKLKPAAPSVDGSTIWPGTVERGPMVINVRGLGQLVPEEIVFIPAAFDCRVEKIDHRAGASLKANDIIMTLSNPDMDLAAHDAEWKWKQAQATLDDLKVKLESSKLDQKAQLADLEAQYTNAKLTADRDMELTRLNLKSELESKLSVGTADALAKRVALQQQRLKINDDSIKAQIEEQQVAVDSARAEYELKQKQVDQLAIRAGVDGVVQEVDVEVGQRVPAGTILAKIADPKKLKAEVKIAETQMKGIALNQPAEIDTRNGIVPGHVIRIDPAAQNGTVTVDVKLDGPLPPDSRPQLSVDGTIELDRLADTIKMGRPVFGQQNSTVGLFKIDPDGRGATHVNVKLGMASVNEIQVLDGLKVGDRVILSDMSQWDSYSRIRLDPAIAAAR